MLANVYYFQTKIISFAAYVNKPIALNVVTLNNLTSYAYDFICSTHRCFQWCAAGLFTQSDAGHTLTWAWPLSWQLMCSTWIYTEWLLSWTEGVNEECKLPLNCLYVYISRTTVDDFISWHFTNVPLTSRWVKHFVKQKVSFIFGVCSFCHLSMFINPNKLIIYLNNRSNWKLCWYGLK